MHLTDKQIIAFLNNRLSDKEKGDLMSHISECERCERKFNFISLLRESIAEFIEIGKCPSPEDLATYISGLAEPELAEEIEKHLEKCDICRREAESIKNMFEDALKGFEAYDPAKDESMSHITFESFKERLMEEGFELIALQPASLFEEVKKNFWGAVKRVSEKIIRALYPEEIDRFEDTFWAISNFMDRSKIASDIPLTAMGLDIPSSEEKSLKVILTVARTLEKIKDEDYVDEDTLRQVIRESSRDMKLGREISNRIEYLFIEEMVK